MSRFENKTVIVTGASRGIGAATAKRFASEGANIVINSRSREDLEKVAVELDERRTLIFEGDVAEQGFAEELVAATKEKFGGIEVVVANAGVAAFGPFPEATNEDIQRVMSVNVIGNMYLVRAVYEELKKTSGNIVVTSSVSGIGGDWGLAIYNASKGAVTNFVRGLALEFGADGIRVNAVNPSFTRTEMTDELAAKPEVMEAFSKRFALSRVGEPEDVAAAIAFLASSDASFITGVNLPVDGGLSASNGQPNVM